MKLSRINSLGAQSPSPDEPSRKINGGSNDACSTQPLQSVDHLSRKRRRESDDDSRASDARPRQRLRVPAPGTTPTQAVAVPRHSSAPSDQWLKRPASQGKTSPRLPCDAKLIAGFDSDAGLAKGLRAQQTALSTPPTTPPDSPLAQHRTKTAVEGRYALQFSDLTCNYEQKSFPAMIVDGLIVPQDGRDIEPDSRFLFGIDMAGNLHLAEDPDGSVLHTNLLGLSASGIPNPGICFGEVQADEFGRVAIINNRSGHTLPSPEHLRYALSLPALAELDPEVLVQQYASATESDSTDIRESGLDAYRQR